MSGPGGEDDPSWEAVVQWQGQEITLGTYSAGDWTEALKEAKRRLGAVAIEARPSGVVRDYEGRRDIVAPRDGFRTAIKAEKRARVGPKGERPDYQDLENGRKKDG